MERISISSIAGYNSWDCEATCFGLQSATAHMAQENAPLHVFEHTLKVLVDFGSDLREELVASVLAVDGTTPCHWFQHVVFY